MIDKEQYIETLIKLIELNSDQTWIETFMNLKKGGRLPGGGASSLNDWRPFYTNTIQNVWYFDLYRIMRFLFDNDMTPTLLNHFAPIRNNDKLQILRCVECNGRYQHPAIFESHISVNFYRQKIIEFYDENRLIEILDPLRSYENPLTISYRLWIENEYKRLGINIYDFVKADYICPHCGYQRSDKEYDLYKVGANLIGGKKINHIKDNANINDFK